MPIRSLIGILNENNKINAIYCHYDGYIDNIGDKLIKNYNNIDKVKELINKGNIQSLENDINKIKAYDNNEIKEYSSEDEYKKENYEYLYLFKNDKWYYKRNNEKSFNELNKKINISESLHSRINENSLSRLWQHTQDDTTFAIIGSNDKDTHEDRSKELMQLVRENSFKNSRNGWSNLEGTYTYEDGHTEVERSCIIYNITKQNALNIAKELNQESIIWKDEDFFGIIGVDGDIMYKFTKDPKNMSFEDVENFSSRLMQKNNINKHNSGKAFNFKLEKLYPNKKSSIDKLGGYDIIKETLLSINESASISRIYKHMKEHDVACISASKYLPNRNDYYTQQEYEIAFKDRLGKQKKLDDEALRIALSGEGYGVIRIKGFYQYSKTSAPSKENSYLVINRNDDPNFLNTVLELAKEAKQNSIYFVPKDTFEGSWYYTGVDLSKPGNIDDKHKFGDVEYKGPVHFGTYSSDEKGELGYSLINGRPFSSYIDGQIQKDVKKVKTKNIHNNITVIDESLFEPCTYTMTKEFGHYLSKVRRCIEESSNIDDDPGGYFTSY